MSSSSQPHDAASSHPAAAAAPVSRSAAVSAGSVPAQPLRSTSPVYRHELRGPNHTSRSFRCQDSSYRAARAASPSACAGVTHSTANGPSSMNAMPGSSRPAAVCSAGSSSSGPGVFQNGAMDSAQARASTRFPASSRSLNSASAQEGDASARAAKPCCSGQTTTAARRYQRSIVLPEFTMYPVYWESYGLMLTDGVEAHTCTSGTSSEMSSPPGTPVHQLRVSSETMM